MYAKYSVKSKQILTLKMFLRHDVVSVTLVIFREIIHTHEQILTFKILFEAMT